LRIARLVELDERDALVGGRVREHEPALTVGGQHERAHTGVREVDGLDAARILRVAWNIDAIRELGIGIDVDDFGTGHTSIVSLLKLKPRRFKIDRQLISPIVNVPEQRRLAASIIDIGKSLGIKVVAEGVETMEQARILRELGCDILQGYAFARPMPASQLAGWIEGEDWRKAS